MPSAPEPGVCAAAGYTTIGSAAPKREQGEKQSQVPL